MEQKEKIRNICYIGLFVAVIAVLAQISIPMPGGVPMTLQTFAIPLAGMVLGARRGAVASIVYLIVGAVGVPVFAGFSGGFANVIGPTGGFLISFPLMALCAGLGMKKGGQPAILGGLFLGALLNYVCGTLWFMAVMGSSLAAALTACVIPFLPTAVLKIILVDLVGVRCKRLLVRAGVFA
ncbi:MAG: biotin transporter BioY [Eubacteriales bacterium]|nr:biotin transporter BioY [Eubacteriales bacterium]